MGWKRIAILFLEGGSEPIRLDLSENAYMRPAGLEPASQPWKGCILPLYYERSESLRINQSGKEYMVHLGIDPSTFALSARRSTI